MTTPSWSILLKERIHMQDIQEIHNIIKNHNHRKEELYALIYNEDTQLSYQALWACTHLAVTENKWLETKQQELIDAAIICPHTGKRRLLLQLLERQSFTDTPRVDFLNFCLDRMFSPQEPPAVQSLCIKLAYKLCQPIPELTQELRTLLEMQREEFLTPATKSSRRQILKAINKPVG